MNSNCYIIDTSSLIHLNKYNPIDVFPTIWQKLELLISERRLLAPKEVLYEINEKDDQLAKWAKHQPSLFKDSTPRQIEIVKDILRQYPSMVKEYKTHDADSWVIALTIEMASSSQQTLTPIKRIVVTEEKLRGDKIKIPWVCEKYDIETIDILHMFRIEGWKF